jgi:hypothetical protein
MVRARQLPVVIGGSGPFIDLTVSLRVALVTGPIDSLLWEIVRDVEPTPTQKSGAQRSHNYLRSLLNSGQMAGRIATSYLSGSYARDTAIRPLDDVDIVFDLVPNAYPAHGLLAEMPNPEQVLESFARAIRYRYPVSSVFGQRRSVRLELEHLDIDVVPAVVDRRDPLLIYVPDRETNGWLKSSPRRHSDNATRINARTQGRFKPLVKLMKYWNYNLPDTIRAKSFMIETIAARLFDSLKLSSLEEGSICFLDFLGSRFGESSKLVWQSDYGMSFGFLGVSIPDAAGTGSNTAGKFDNARARALASKARISRERLESAQKARTVDSQRGWILDAFRTS